MVRRSIPFGGSLSARTCVFDNVASDMRSRHMRGMFRHGCLEIVIVEYECLRRSL